MQVPQRRTHKSMSGEMLLNKAALIEEHKELVRVLKKGDKKDIKKEAREQGEELNKLKKK